MHAGICCKYTLYTHMAVLNFCTNPRAQVVVDKMAKIGFIAGTIQQDKLNAFERLLFRATRGNLFLKSAEMEEMRDPATGEMQKKSVFVVFFAGDRSRLKAGKVGDGQGCLPSPPAHTACTSMCTQ